MKYQIHFTISCFLMHTVNIHSNELATPMKPVITPRRHHKKLFFSAKTLTNLGGYNGLKTILIKITI